MKIYAFECSFEIDSNVDDETFHEIMKDYVINSCEYYVKLNS